MSPCRPVKLASLRFEVVLSKKANAKLGFKSGGLVTVLTKTSLSLGQLEQASRPSLGDGDARKEEPADEANHLQSKKGPPAVLNKDKGNNSRLLATYST